MAQLITKSVHGLGFGWLTPEEIRSLSVKRIVTSDIYDDLNLPVPGGLYDPALGPLERLETCPTCHHPAQQCPGHMGYIELSVPVYHPLLFTTMLRLLKAKCFVCHRFRCSRIELKAAVTKLHLIEAGLLMVARSVDDVLISSTKQTAPKKTRDKSDDEERTVAKVVKKRPRPELPLGKTTLIELETAMQQAVQNEEDTEIEEDQSSNDDKLAICFERLEQLWHTADAQLRLHGSHINWTAMEIAEKRQVQLALQKSLNQRKCQSCGAFSPSLKRDGFTKIFRLQLTEQNRKANEILGLKFPNIIDMIATDSVSKLALQTLSRIENLSTFSKSENANGSKRTSKRRDPVKSLPVDVLSSGSDGDDSDNDAIPRLNGDLETQELDGLVTAASGNAHPPKMSNSSSTTTANQFSNAKQQLMFPSEVEKHLQLLWEAEEGVVSHIWGSVCKLKHVKTQLCSSDYRMFFIRALPVPPPRTRPPTKVGDVNADHAQNVYFRRIIDQDQRIRDFNGNSNRAAPGKDNHASQNHEVVKDLWLALQEDVNLLLDNSKATNTSLQVPNGIRQAFERKEGLFRRNMMGKRVNYAARSVISPDPFISSREIGVPEHFALELTFPEVVTPHNVVALRQAVENGAFKHPGANFVQDSSGNLTNLAYLSDNQRIALSKTLLTGNFYDSLSARNPSGVSMQFLGHTCKRVYRHLRSGDVVLMNRQPTLHKPSMMAHRVRVMRNKAWQTLRMHYVNCNAYNADFDGDEMNLHFPQNQLARSELSFIANNDNQYLVPTDGSPLRGLIQDHVASGVLISKLDRLMNRQEFHQLLFTSLDNLDNDNAGLAVSIPLPAICKPRCLWTGKQLCSTILKLIIGNRPGLNFTSKSKVPVSQWGQHTQESTVCFREGYLCTGVLDKNQFGDAPKGLVHACYELYGAIIAGDLFTVLGRLFTTDLQNQGHSCGIDDMLLHVANEKNRVRLVAEAMKTGTRASLTFAEILYDEADQHSVSVALRSKLAKDPVNRAKLDGIIKSAMNGFTSQIISACLPGGQKKAFPQNMMARMILTGAKGSMVNFSQICCLLGQQELEGRRVPLAATGRSLPSFRPYDPSPRAGGYVADRFLTGIKPQEYFFHCMAGREGLIDTAVKTARSGYLQRCLIKHLESLSVQYDHTVRDNDGTIIQFLYGEDGIDICKTAYLKDFGFLASNCDAVLHKLNATDAFEHLDLVSAAKYQKRHDAHLSKPEKHRGYTDPVLSVFPPGRHLGSVSDSFRNAYKQYIHEDPDRSFTKESAQRDAKSTYRFEGTMLLNFVSSLVQPGENVGILAAQSIGEPSTQMTLNTFHLAGHGGANVTLGIPRLREIVMTASMSIKTPIMEVPLLPSASRQQAESVAARLDRIRLVDFVTNATVCESLRVDKSGHGAREYTVHLDFMKPMNEKYRAALLQWNDFTNAFEKFCFKLGSEVVKQIKKLGEIPDDRKGISISSKSMDQPAQIGSISEDSNAEAQRQREKKDEGIGYDKPDAEDREVQLTADNNDVDENTDIENELSGDDRDQADEASDDDDLDETAYKIRRMPHVAGTMLNKDESWCEVVLSVAVKVPKLLVMSMVESVCDRVLLRSTSGISGARVIEKVMIEGQPKELVLQTDGVNFAEIWQHSDVLNVKRIYSNDIGAMLNTYGVEAAQACISREISTVFGVYGISVDYRHLNLIADYMTNQGGYRPLNRTGISSNPSPLQKASFETSINFILQACMGGESDQMCSPSSSIVVGQPVKIGTGAFGLLARTNALPG